jgi:hypothetical protein
MLEKLLSGRTFSHPVNFFQGATMRNLLLAGVAFTLAFSAAAYAATTTFQSPQQITGDADVVNTPGTVGYNFAGSAVTINGVGFVAVPFTDATTDTSTNGLVVITSPSATMNAFGSFGGTGSAAYTNFLTNEIYNEVDGHEVPYNVAVSGLTSGTPYRVQFFVNDTRDCCDFRSVTVTGGANTSAPLDYNTTNPVGFDGGLGQYVIGYFIADATSQTFTITGLPFSSGSTQLAGFTIYALPEPASLSLLGVAGLVFVRRRR